MRILPRISKILLTTIISVFILSGCGGGGGVSPSGTGSVAVLLTDGPSQDFSEINLTIKEILLLGNSSQVSIFKGDETINLLDLESYSDLFAIQDNVPEGSYDKIRLILSDVALIKRDADGKIVEEYHPKLPGNGKLDLNPRGGFYVVAGETLHLQIDIDADKAIHVVSTGNEKYQFRPVVFVDIVDHLTPGKLVRSTGTIYSINTLEQSFILCDKEISGNNPSTVKWENCIKVYAENSALFNGNGDPILFSDLKKNDAVVVYGKVTDNNNAVATSTSSLTTNSENDVDIQMSLDAIMVALGSPDSFLHLKGMVANPYDSVTSQFTITPDANQGFTSDSELTVKLDASTPVITPTGEPLDPALYLTTDTSVKIMGVLMSTDTTIFKSTLIIAKVMDANAAKISGEITYVKTDFSEIIVTNPSGAECITLDQDTSVYEINGGTSNQLLSNQLMTGMQVDVYGTSNGVCYQAQDIFVFPTPTP